ARRDRGSHRGGGSGLPLGGGSGSPASGPASGLALFFVRLLREGQCAKYTRRLRPEIARENRPGVEPGVVARNRDGHLDLVTQHLLSSSVAILSGDGQGNFASFDGAPLRLG